MAEAAAAAQVHEAILSLPAGYETKVGERGGRLSGGQRQRVALARALVRQPSILMLDEPTAALDPATEAALNATLEQLSRARTVISVTHRLASVVKAERILVMQAGRLVQLGSHAQLVSCDGVYRELWEQQSGFVLSADGQHAQVRPSRLKAIPLLEGLAEDLLSILATHFVTERYPTGAVILEEGEPGDKFCILARGTVEVSRVDAAGQARHVAILEEGDFFGEIALLSDVRRTATVRARTPSVVLSLARDQFLNLAASSPAWRVAIEEVAERRRRELLSVTA
ncbi:MAG: cyclic nucleotide-binding domain-containing protein [Chloroflexi bacterium]|nr:cyclic nucleotide-binding domain-containing protein [Chloroflexota bacterium]